MDRLLVVLLGLSWLLAPDVAQAAKPRRPPVFSGVVNLNDASAAQLDALPGIGPKAAGQIIAHRAKAPFRRIEELVKVKGFGKKRFERLRSFLSVSGPTTLRVRKDG